MTHNTRRRGRTLLVGVAALGFAALALLALAGIIEAARASAAAAIIAAGTGALTLLGSRTEPPHSQDNGTEAAS
jgi:hypothetical protein